MTENVKTIWNTYEEQTEKHMGEQYEKQYQKTKYEKNHDIKQSWTYKNEKQINKTKNTRQKKDEYTDNIDMFCICLGPRPFVGCLSGRSAPESQQCTSRSTFWA